MPNTVRMAATPLDRRAILKSHALFGQLTESEIDQLLAQARVARYRAGEVIFLKSSPGTGMMAVLKGEVRISAPAPDGREIVLNTMREGEIFGEIALLDGKERSADAVAQCACELLVIERRSFVPFLRNNPEVALRLISVLCERLRRTTEQVEDMLFRDLPSRLAKKLLELAEEGGERSASGLRIATRLSQRELGTRVGMSRESINKQLRQWQIEGLVAVEEGRILLRDETALRAIADPPA
ncbi:MAG TPA: Crp/Fnr family transcriptional regulator [Stellaceae bacterium]|nr:Crp/Fnr family transcriptional regulator [Stellaceae bacterium]